MDAGRSGWPRAGVEKEETTLGRSDFSNTRGSCGHCIRLHCRRILSGLHASAPARREAHAQVARKDYFCCGGSRLHTLGAIRRTASLAAPKCVLAGTFPVSRFYRESGKTSGGTPLTSAVSSVSSGRGLYAIGTLLSCSSF